MTAGLGGVTLFVVLRAFASGSTALTGVEAIANGVNAFRRPHGINAAKTLAVLGAIAIAMFVGVSWLAVHMHARPNASGTPSVLSQIARGVFPSSSSLNFMYWAVQVLTLAVLVLAANTSFQGFPRLAALLARDSFFARQFTNLGDRLVFSNGIVVLAGVSSLLLWAYNASVDSLIHLYVIGVFTAFTLSQAGMVRYWQRSRDRGWRRRACRERPRCDGNRDRHARRHLDEVRRGRVARARRDPTARRSASWASTATTAASRVASPQAPTPSRRQARPTNRVLLWVESIDVATEGALWYARRISNGPLRALHVPGRRCDPGIRPRWFDFADGEPRLEVLGAEEGRSHAVLEEIWKLPRGEADFVTLVVPEQFRRRSLVSAAGRTLVPPEDPRALRAGDRRRRRTGGDDAERAGGTHADASRRSRADLRSSCRLDARDQLRPVARRRGHASRVLRVRR